MKKLIALVLAMSCIFALVGCGKSETYTISITVPAGSAEAFVYSDEEISPKGHTITISSGEGLGDTEVALKTVQVKEKTEYSPEYLTPGMAVEMEVEKGAWFKIGVSVQNDTDTDKTVYIEVTGVEIRVE